MKQYLQDPIFFYAIAYVIFLAVAWKFARKPALRWIDGEIEKIRDELGEARKLRAEAEAMLVDCRAKKAAAIVEAKAIVAHAGEEAARLAAEAETNLKFLLAKHEQHALDRIRYMEEEATVYVRQATINMALDIVRKTLAEQMDDAAFAKLADQAIADMPKLVTAKKAA